MTRTIADKLIPNPDGNVPPKVPQWINCDIRSFDYSVLGQYVPHYLAQHESLMYRFQVIVADPPWDIHMSVRPQFFLVYPLLDPDGKLRDSSPTGR